MYSQRHEYGRPRTSSGGQRVVDGDVAVVDAEGGGDQGIEIYQRITRGRAGKHRARRGAAEAARFGLEDSGIRKPGVIPLYNDVHAIFQRQLDRFLQAQLQLSVVDELLDPRGI